MFWDAEAHGSHVGGYWTYEKVDHRDCRSFDRSQLQKENLGLCEGDQIAVLFEGHWTAGFVGIIGDPHNPWPTMLSAPDVDFEVDGILQADLPQDPTIRQHIPSSVHSLQVVTRKVVVDQVQHVWPFVVDQVQHDWTFTCYPPPNEPFIDITVKVVEGQGIRGTRLDECEFINDPRNWRDNFCCSYEVVRVFQSDWGADLREIDGATIAINRESNKVLRRLSASPEQQDAFLHNMQRPQRYQEEHFDERSFNHRSPPRARGQRASRGASTRSEGFHRGRYAFSAPSNQEHWPRDQPVREKPFHGQWTDSGSPRRDGARSSRGSSGIDGLAWRNAWRPVAATAKPAPASASASKTVVDSKSMAKPASASSYKSAADSKSIAKLASALSVKTAAGPKSMAKFASASSSKTAASSKSMAKPKK